MINKRLLFLLFLYFNIAQSLLCYFAFKEGLTEDLRLPAQEINGNVCFISIAEDIEIRNLQTMQSRVPENQVLKFDVSKKMMCEASVGTNLRVNCFCATTDYCNSIEEAMGILSQMKKHENIVQRYESVYAKFHEYVLCDQTRIELGFIIFTVFTGICALYIFILFFQPFTMNLKKRKYFNQ